MKRRIIAAAMALTILAAQIIPNVSFPSASAASTETTITAGDSNANGIIDSYDLLALQTYITTSAGVTSAWQNSDMNSDKALNVIDFAKMAHRKAGLLLLIHQRNMFFK